MFSIQACMPWMARGSAQDKAQEGKQNTSGLLSAPRSNAFEPVAPAVTSSRLVGTVRDIENEMTRAGVRTSLPIQLTQATRDKLEAAGKEFAGVDINDIDEFKPLAEKPANQDAPQESQAIRDVLFGLKILDFPLTTKDTFFVIQLLQREDALSSGDLESIFKAYGRETPGKEVVAALEEQHSEKSPAERSERQERLEKRRALAKGCDELTRKTAEFMNTENLAEDLLFQAACSYVENVSNRFMPQFTKHMEGLCAQLDKSVRDKMADHLVQPMTSNRMDTRYSLRKPVESSAEGVKKPPQTMSKPLSHFYPRTQKVALNY